MNTLPIRVVAIHQPNFFPWLGYFNKILRSDVFVIQDNVQFPKRHGGTWENRVRLLLAGEPTWVTMPIVRTYEGVRRINEMQIDNSKPWRARLIKTIETNYARAPFFREISPIICELVSNKSDNLSEYNLTSILRLAELLELKSSTVIRGSELEVNGTATDLLVSQVKAAGGTSYLCGGGASEYQVDEKFAEAGLELIYQNFTHPVYQQINGREFVPGLSIIDCLMNCGLEETKVILRGSSPQQ